MEDLKFRKKNPYKLLYNKQEDEYTVCVIYI